MGSVNSMKYFLNYMDKCKIKQEGSKSMYKRSLALVLTFAWVVSCAIQSFAAPKMHKHASAISKNDKSAMVSELLKRGDIDSNNLQEVLNSPFSRLDLGGKLSDSFLIDGPGGNHVHRIWVFVKNHEKFILLLSVEGGELSVLPAIKNSFRRIRITTFLGPESPADEVDYEFNGENYVVRR